VPRGNPRDAVTRDGARYESYTIRLKKPMGLVFEEYQTIAKGIFVAVKTSRAFPGLHRAAPTRHESARQLTQ
jgi:hypothetical protein